MNQLEQPTVISVNISEKKGTSKSPVDFVLINEKGVAGDAHAGHWNRQVSLLAMESILKFDELSHRNYLPGDFAENITTQGIDLLKLKPLDCLLIGEARLEVTQIGKRCHGEGCEIFREVGNCVMPKEGIFCRVIFGGPIRAGDAIHHHPKIFRVHIITLSDRAFRGEYEDLSGPKSKELIADFFKESGYPCDISHQIIPDDAQRLYNLLATAKNENIDLVFTTGGTGIGHRDITPDVTLKMIDKEIPGIMEMIRLKYGEQKPNALLSRAVAGAMGNTLVFNMPGSVKAVNEYTHEIFKSLKHTIYMLHGLELH